MYKYKECTLISICHWRVPSWVSSVCVQCPLDRVQCPVYVSSVIQELLLSGTSSVYFLILEPLHWKASQIKQKMLCEEDRWQTAQKKRSEKALEEELLPLLEMPVKQEVRGWSSKCYGWSLNRSSTLAHAPINQQLRWRIQVCDTTAVSRPDCVNLIASRPADVSQLPWLWPPLPRTGFRLISFNSDVSCCCCRCIVQCILFEGHCPWCKTTKGQLVGGWVTSNRVHLHI